MVIMKDLIRKIRSKGRVDAKSRYWVSELLAVDCEKAWIGKNLCRNGMIGCPFAFLLLHSQPVARCQLCSEPLEG